VALPRGERERERQAGPVGNQVDLGADAPTREAERMLLRLLRIPFLLAPAAERLARTDVLSMHHRSKAISPSVFSLSRSRSRSRSNRPSRRQQLKRSYIVCHGPYRSGRSRHWAPVASFHISPFTTCRWSRQRPPPRGFDRGMRSAISSHCASLSSCRRIAGPRHGDTHQANYLRSLSLQRPPDRT
jgi:hypothetical protein